MHEREDLMRIILAIGEMDLRLAIGLLLSEEPGLNIVGSASDTEGLLAMAKTNCPDLVLLDWELPGRAVIEVVNDIKSLECYPKLVVLGTQPELKGAALNAGADDYVCSGDPPEHLLAAVNASNIQG
jgi:DNA-binding NarL/FixJ family response regulator